MRSTISTLFRCEPGVRYDAGFTRAGIGLVVALLVLGCSESSSGGALVQDAGATADTGLSNADSKSTDAPGAGPDAVASADAAGATWDATDVTEILLQETTIVVNGPGAVVAGTTVTIQAGGAYRISGSLPDGQIVVDTLTDEDVRIALAGVDVSSATTAPFVVLAAEDVELWLEEGTDNTFRDASTYVYPAGEDEPNACVFSKQDLTIVGPGRLVVVGNYNDGIASKDSLRIGGGRIEVSAADDGLRGKDDITISGGEIVVVAGGDGLKSDDSDDAARGYIQFDDGVVDVVAGGDGVQAETTITVNKGIVSVQSGGGNTAALGSDESAKGLKANVGVHLAGGVVTVDAADDGVHSNGDIVVSGGDVIIASGDDGVHADGELTIDDGVLEVTGSYEGLESTLMTINGGSITLVASDDGVNVAGGADASGRGGPGGRWQPGGSSDQYHLYIHGGVLAVYAEGDGIDSNGSITITGGTSIVHGPTESMNGALDFGEGNASFVISGGVLVAAGSSGMAVAPDESSTQRSVMINPGSRAAGSLIHLETSDGVTVLTFAPTKTWQSVVFSAPGLQAGTYHVYLDGSATGLDAHGYTSAGSYTPGTLYETIELTGMTTTVGQTRGGPGGPGGPPGRFRRGVGDGISDDFGGFDRFRGPPPPFMRDGESPDEWFRFSHGRRRPGFYPSDRF